MSLPLLRQLVDPSGSARDLLTRLMPGAKLRPATSSRREGEQPSRAALLGEVAADVIAREPATADEAPGLDRDSFDRLAVRALVLAARADGHLSADQIAAMVAELETCDLDAESRELLRQELLRPAMLDGLARGLTSRRDMVELYAASVVGANRSDPVGRHYLEMLAARLGLENAVTAEVEATVGRLGL